jgi:hypothetical protein
MFEELRLRAQTFEVLLGGDLSGSQIETALNPRDVLTAGPDDSQEAEGEPRAFGLVSLPEQMADSLRVDLSVWRSSVALQPSEIHN